MTPDEMIPGRYYLATIRGEGWVCHDQVVTRHGNRVEAMGGWVRPDMLTNVRPVALIDHHEWSDGLDIEIGEETRAQWDAALPGGAPVTQAETTTRRYPRIQSGGGMAL